MSMVCGDSPNHTVALPWDRRAPHGARAPVHLASGTASLAFSSDTKVETVEGHRAGRTV
jgi:hypothetical protein